ncbi:acyl--CoA ligase [Candidatus Saccharibacteria bacterium]|nr:acyl--CoA ligase [Candidatus Saccharibacteria bacterium]
MDTNIHALGTTLNTMCGSEEIVTHCGLAAIDSILLFFAANAVGKKVNYLFPEFISMDPVGYIEATGTKTLVILDIFYDEVAEALAKIKLDRVVISSLADYASPTINEAWPDDLKEMLSKSLFEEIRDNAPCDIGYELISWNDFMRIGEGQTLSQEELSKIPADDVAGIFYTGGSTGRPKGIQLTNEGILKMGWDICGHHNDVFDYMPGDREFVQIPPGHAITIVFTVIGPMLRGCTLAICSLYDMSRFLDDIRLLKPNHIICCAVQLLALIERADLKEGELSFVKQAVQAGEKLYGKDAKKLSEALLFAGAQRPLVNAYGMTELGLMAMLGGWGSLEWMPSSYLVRCRLIDEQGNEIEGDGVGQLEILTPAVMLGYFNNEKATDEFFSKDGWAITGNVAERKTFENGGVYYDVMGRNSNATSFNARNGERIYGPIIDRFMSKYKQVFRFQTVALPVSGRNETHVLVVHMVFDDAFKHGRDKFLRELVLAWREEFKGALVPAGFRVHEDSLPMNSTTHKIDVAGMAREYGSIQTERNGKLVQVHLVG